MGIPLKYGLQLIGLKSAAGKFFCQLPPDIKLWAHICGNKCWLKTWRTVPGDSAGFMMIYR